MSRSEDISLLFSSGCDAKVVKHCEVVAELAQNFSGESVDSELIERGAALHDLGRCKTHAIDHARVGAELCRAMSEDESLCRIIERHTGAGLSFDECTLLGLEPVDCIPKTLEEKIVAHADNLVKSSKVISLEERMIAAAELSGRAKRRIWRLGVEVELLRK